jgi:hypothetical protein
MDVTLETVIFVLCNSLTPVGASSIAVKVAHTNRADGSYEADIAHFHTRHTSRVGLADVID